MDFTTLPIDRTAALVVVDLQNDFLPGGALAVPNGDQIIADINQVTAYFAQRGGRVVFTQDWHPAGHKSFASAHSEKKPGDPITTPGLGPILWPDHCVQDTRGAEISKAIRITPGVAIVKKGYTPEIDSYSAFYENDQASKTGLAGLLRDLGVQKVFICGLALDYCCFYSAMDAKREGFDVWMLVALSKGIDQPANSIASALTQMQEAGVHLLHQ